MSRLVVLAYDIADDDRRRAVARHCEQRMLRVQESVFEAWLSAAEMRMIAGLLTALIDPSKDQVRIYPLALRELTRRQVIGAMPHAAPIPDHYLI